MSAYGEQLPITKQKKRETDQSEESFVSHDLSLETSRESSSHLPKVQKKMMRTLTIIKD
jgi:hypothetical protein